MQESRLFKIVYYLLDKGQATASELAKEFEVSVRTIYRDIDSLSGAGIPIYTETGRNGGVYLKEHFVLDKIVLSEQEKKEILTGLQSLSIVENTYEKNILTKLSALFNVQTENWFEVDFSRWGSESSDNEKFELLRAAIIEHNIIQILYTNPMGLENQRKVQPIKLLYKSKEWYLKAYCLTKQDFRIFKFNRIINLKVLDEKFPPLSYPKPQNEEVKNYNTIILQFPQEMAYRVYDEFEDSQIKRQENGSLIVTSKLPEDGWLIGYLLSFGNQVDIIEPFHLRTILAKEAKKIYNKNKP